MINKNAFNTVTPISKAIALVLFILFPFASFYLGTIYQRTLDRPFMSGYEKIRIKEETENGVMCTMEAKICSDGSAVGRSGPKCEFAKCPDEY